MHIKGCQTKLQKSDWATRLLHWQKTQKSKQNKQQTSNSQFSQQFILKSKHSHLQANYPMFKENFSQLKSHSLVGFQNPEQQHKRITSQNVVKFQFPPRWFVEMDFISTDHFLKQYKYLSQSNYQKNMLEIIVKDAYFQLKCKYCSVIIRFNIEKQGLVLQLGEVTHLHQKETKPLFQTQSAQNHLLIKQESILSKNQRDEASLSQIQALSDPIRNQKEDQFQKQNCLMDNQKNQENIKWPKTKHQNYIRQSFFSEDDSITPQHQTYKSISRNRQNLKKQKTNIPLKQQKSDTLQTNILQIRRQIQKIIQIRTADCKFLQLLEPTCQNQNKKPIEFAFSQYNLFNQGQYLCGSKLLQRLQKIVAKDVNKVLYLKVEEEKVCLSCKFCPAIIKFQFANSGIFVKQVISNHKHYNQILNKASNKYQTNEPFTMANNQNNRIKLRRSKRTRKITKRFTQETKMYRKQGISFYNSLCPFRSHIIKKIKKTHKKLKTKQIKTRIYYPSRWCFDNQFLTEDEFIQFLQQDSQKLFNQLIFSRQKILFGEQHDLVVITCKLCKFRISYKVLSYGILFIQKSMAHYHKNQNITSNRIHKQNLNFINERRLRNRCRSSVKSKINSNITELKFPSYQSPQQSLNQLNQIIKQQNLMVACLKSRNQLIYQIFISPLMKLHAQLYGDAIYLSTSIAHNDFHKFRFAFILGFDYNEEAIVLAVIVTSEMYHCWNSIFDNYFRIVEKMPSTITLPKQIYKSKNQGLCILQKIYEIQIHQQTERHLSKSFVGFQTQCWKIIKLSKFIKNWHYLSNLPLALKQIIVILKQERKIITLAKTYDFPYSNSINYCQGIRKIMNYVSAANFQRIVVNYIKANILIQNISLKGIDLSKHDKTVHTKLRKGKAGTCTCKEYLQTHIPCPHIFKEALLQRSQFQLLIPMRWRVWNNNEELVDLIMNKSKIQ